MGVHGAIGPDFGRFLDLRVRTRAKAALTFRFVVGGTQGQLSSQALVVPHGSSWMLLLPVDKPVDNCVNNLGQRGGYLSGIGEAAVQARSKLGLGVTGSSGGSAAPVRSCSWHKGSCETPGAAMFHVKRSQSE
jgi:hypothetical protein